MARRSCSPHVVHRFYPLKITYIFITAVALAFSFSACFAQEVATNRLPDAPSSQTFPAAAAETQSVPDNAAISIPPGTKLNLVLANTVDSRKTKTGDQVSAQVTTPVVLNNQVVIPAGTFVQGKAQKLTRRGTQAEMQLQSASLVFPDGYIANIGAVINMESDEWTAFNNPGGGTRAAMIAAPLGGLGLGLLIGSAADHTKTTTLGGITISSNLHEGLGIGGLIGLGAGGAVSLVLLARSRGFYIEQGAPMSMTLPQTVTLTQSQVDSAQSAPAPPPVPVVQRRPPPAMSPGTNGPVFTGPASCTTGQEWCQGQCKDSVDFISDSSNCGRCGNQCSFSETCTGGSCVCAPSYTSCMGQCMSDASFISDNNNCGSCGHSCGVGEMCTGGSCMKVGP